MARTTNLQHIFYFVLYTDLGSRGFMQRSTSLLQLFSFFAYFPGISINVGFLGSVLETPWWCHQMETFSVLLALCEHIGVQCAEKARWNLKQIWRSWYTWVSKDDIKGFENNGVWVAW